MSETEDTWVTERWTYIGRRWENRKLYHVFLRAVDDPQAKEAYFKSKPDDTIIGGVYEIEVSEDSARVRDAKFIRRCGLDDQISEWRVLDWSARDMQQADRAAKRLAKENSDIGGLTLAELREAMEGQPQHVQAGTLVVVMQFLQRSKQGG